MIDFKVERIFDEFQEQNKNHRCLIFLKTCLFQNSRQKEIQARSTSCYGLLYEGQNESIKNIIDYLKYTRFNSDLTDEELQRVLYPIKPIFGKTNNPQCIE